MDWNQITAFVTSVFAQPEVEVMLAHIAVNVIVAVAAAITQADFQLAMLASFLWRKVLPLVAVYAAARALGDAAGLSWLAVSVFALLETTLVSDLVPNLARLGIPIPENVVNFFKRPAPITASISHPIHD
jgi:phage-related holin